MPAIEVDGLRFDFPDGWIVSKYDEWAFYRQQWSRMWDGIKAVDILAVDAARTAWFIEVKDYSQNPRTKPSDLADEVAQKIFATLAALLPAKLYATFAEELQMAGAMRAVRHLRVVLHLEQPKVPSRLRPLAIDPAAIRQKLKRIIKPVDAHPLVTPGGQHGWTVTRLQLAPPA